MECADCGLAPCDLPDGIDAEDIFERIDGEWYCQADANGASFTVISYGEEATGQDRSGT